MRYRAAEKLEIIRLVEQSALPVRRTLEKIGILRATFYRWYALYQTGGPEALDYRIPSRIASEPVFRMMSASASSIWRWMSPSKSLGILGSDEAKFPRNRRTRRHSARSR